MAQMFRTIVDWNESVGSGRGNPWLRIMMPFDLREQDDYLMPASNMTSYTFVTSRLSACDDMKQLVTSIRDETLRLKARARRNQLHRRHHAGRLCTGRTSDTC